MEITPDAMAGVGLIVTILSAGIGAAVSYGVTKQQLSDAKEGMKAIKDEQKEYVTYKHLETVLLPFREFVQDVKHKIDDIEKSQQKILIIVSRMERGNLDKADL